MVRIRICHSSFFFLLEGKVPSESGKDEKSPSLSLLFSLQNSCPYSLNCFALGRDKIVSEYMRFLSILLVLPLLLTLIIFDIYEPFRNLHHRRA